MLSNIMFTSVALNVALTVFVVFTLIFLGFVFGYLGFGKLVFYLMTLQFSMVMTEQTLAAVPLFVFMGIMMEQAGLMERLFSAFQLMKKKIRLPLPPPLFWNNEHLSDRDQSPMPPVRKNNLCLTLRKKTDCY